MSTSNELPEPLVIEVSSFHFCNFQNPDIKHGKYGFSLPWQDLPYEVSSAIPESVKMAKLSPYGLVNLRTNRPPRIYGFASDNSDMIFYMQRMSSLNIPPFLGLVGHPGQAFVSFWKKDNGSLGVCVNSIRFDPSKIVLPGFDEMPKWAKA